MLDFQKDFSATQVVRLERNYRSVSNILAVADTVVTRNISRLGKTLYAERGDGKKPAMVFLPNQDDEAAFAASLVQQSLAKGARLSDWAILYRTNAQSLSFETEFLRRKIPYQVVGALKFYEREEIKDALSFLAFIANPRNSVALERIINKPARGIGATTRDQIINHEHNEQHEQSLLESCRKVAATASKKAAAGITDFLSIVSTVSATLNDPTPPDGASQNLSAFIDQVIRSSGLLDYHTERDEIAGTTRGANLQELANSAVPYPLSLEGLLDFLDHIELDRTLDTQDAEADSDAVTLITLHNTKGLEFPRVIITGLEHGIFPRQDKIGGDLEEERRLFYVGITRAKDELYLTSCRIRRLYGHTEGMIPSPFVYEILQRNKNMLRVLGDPPGYELKNCVNG
jgi:DNA helicase-2/ATP-dependent DNA helicase PcrA